MAGMLFCSLASKGDCFHNKALIWGIELVTVPCPACSWEPKLGEPLYFASSLHAALCIPTRMLAGAHPRTTVTRTPHSCF